MIKHHVPPQKEKKGLPQKFARFILFRPNKKRSFNLLCVLDPCSSSVQDSTTSGGGKA